MTHGTLGCTKQLGRIDFKQQVMFDQKSIFFSDYGHDIRDFQKKNGSLFPRIINRSNTVIIEQ